MFIRKDAVLARIGGGLGNQLFQYAAARALTLRTNSQLWLDTDFSSRSYRQYRLSNFRICAGIASYQHLFPFTPVPHEPARSWYLNNVCEVFPTLSRLYLSQRGAGIDHRILHTMPPVYVTGYWQSEVYFADQAEAIRQELVLTSPPTPCSLSLLRRIADTRNSVGVHVRRGDYVSDAATFAVHGVCPPSYYQNAARVLKESVGDCTFFVFSDDLPWARQHMGFLAPVEFVDVADADTELEDFRLLTACRHFIIANSTFSWWAAWLSAFPDKHVCMPRRWVADANADTSSIIPVGWRVIDS